MRSPAKLKVRLRVSAAITVVLLLQQSAYALNPHTDPDNVGGWVLNTAVSDEFNGAGLDTSKWIIQGQNGHFENNFLGRAPSQFSPNNVSVSGGFFRINTRWEPDYNFSSQMHNGRSYENITTGAIISKTTFLHGYMEIRCKAADGPISSSFWTTGSGGELDVFEQWGRADDIYQAKRYHTSFHDWRPGSATFGKRIWTNDHLLDFNVQDGFHIYGLEWNPNYLKIYADGKLIQYITRTEIGENAWTVVNAQKVWLDCEVFPWIADPATLSESDYTTNGINFEVDYVRIWQTAGPGSGMQTQANRIANPGFTNGLTHWSASGAVQIVDQGGANGNVVYLNGAGTVEQSVTVKPDTVYVLSAEARMPGSGPGMWSNAWLGVSYDSEEFRYRYFHSEYYYRSLQFRTGPATTNATVFFTNDQTGDQSYVDRFELFDAIDNLTMDRPWYSFVTTHALAGGRTNHTDMDGLNDWGEYVFGGNPTNPADIGIQPVLDLAAGEYQFTLRNDTGIVAYVLSATNLLETAPWATNDIIMAATNDGAMGTHLSNIGTTGNHLFVRLAVDDVGSPPPGTHSGVIIGGSIGNGDFNVVGDGSGTLPFSSSPSWFNAAGSESANFTATTLMGGSSDTPANTAGAIPSRNVVQVNQTGYTVTTAGASFSLSYDFGAGGNAGNWDGTTTHRTFLFTANVPVDAALTTGNITEIVSNTHVLNRATGGQPQWTQPVFSNFYSTVAADIGKTFFFGMVFEDPDGSHNGNGGRVDVIELTVTD